MPDSTGPHILIVDDDVAVGIAMTRLLERSGFRAHVAHSGLEGLAALRERRFDAILCDLRLPFLQGQGLYKELVDDYPEQARRVIFMTGLPPDPKTRALVDETGRPLLHKPIESGDLLAAIGVAMGRSE